MTKRYMVTFFKTVTTDDGHDREIRQNRFEVFASDQQQALSQAKRAFCKQEDLRDWSHHADRCEVEEPDFPS